MIYESSNILFKGVFENPSYYFIPAITLPFTVPDTLKFYSIFYSEQEFHKTFFVLKP
jgi:hypothetical protein